METVIAIGVLAVLLTAFLAVFGPATAGIRKAINVQEADRLASTLERELGTLRDGQETASITNGFGKAFEWIKDSNQDAKALFVYQYRGDPSNLRTDGTMTPYKGTSGVAGKDFVIQPMLRQRSETEFAQDLESLEGRVFAVKTTQLVFNNGALEPGTAGQIVDPKTGSSASSADAYPDAVISFQAEFYEVPTTSPSYLKSGGAFDLTKLKAAMFTRNLAVNR
jgi:hypothetical protein